MSQKIQTLLKELNFKPNEIKVYIALTELGESPASKIAKKIDLPRTTVFSILEKLEIENLVSIHKYKGKTYYWIESPSVLKQTLANKMKIAENLTELLGDLYHSEADFPFSKIYDTKSKIKNFIEKEIIALPKAGILYTIDAPGFGNYEKIYSNDFGNTLINLKNKKQVATKTLIPHGTLNKIEPEKLKRQSIEIKQMPAGIEFMASIWFIGDSVVFLSGKYPFAVEIKHKIISQSLKSIFNYLWKISE